MFPVTQDFLRKIGRPVRIIVALALIALFLWGVDPGFLHPQAMTGKVNAELMTLRAPIDGYVTVPALRTGEYVGRDQIVATIDNPHGDGARERDLQIELRSLDERRAAIVAQIDKLIALQAHLSEEVQSFQDATVQALDARLKEVKARILSTEAVLKNAKAQFARTEALVQSDYASRAKFDQQRALMDTATHDLAALKAEQLRLEREYDAATKGVFIGDNFNNTPYSHQRRDEIQLQEITLQRELADLDTRRTTISSQLDAEHQNQAQRLTATVVAPKAGVAWRLTAANGEFVNAGSPLLQLVDCDRSFFDVLLGTRSFNRLSLGDQVQIYIDGYDLPMTGHIAALRGGADVDPRGFALNLVPDRQEQVQWIVEIDWPEGTKDKCPVGRSGEIVRSGWPILGIGPRS